MEILTSSTSEIAQAKPSDSAAVAHVDFLIHETKKSRHLKYFRDFLKGDNDQKKLAFYVDQVLKTKSRDLAPKVSMSLPDAQINAIALAPIAIVLGKIIGTAVLAAVAKWVTDKLLDRYGPSWFDKEPDTTSKGGFTIIITRVSQSLHSPTLGRDITTEEVVEEIKKDLEAAKGNVPDFPSDETWTVAPQNSSRIEDGKNPIDHFGFYLTLVILITSIQFLTP